MNLNDVRLVHMGHATKKMRRGKKNESNLKTQKLKMKTMTDVSFLQVRFNFFRLTINKNINERALIMPIISNQCLLLLVYTLSRTSKNIYLHFENKNWKLNTN